MKINECVMIEAFKCNEEDTVVEVAKKLKMITLRHIFVVDSKDYPTGIISVIDINNRVVAEGKDASKMKAKEIMSKVVDVAKAEEDVDGFFKKLMEKGHVMAPVVEGGKMTGVITINQLIKCKSE